jgi:hypothetical protein
MLADFLVIANNDRMSLGIKERTIESLRQLQDRLPAAGDSVRARFWTLVTYEGGDQDELRIGGTIERSVGDDSSEIVFKSSSDTPPVEFIVTPETVASGSLRVLSRRAL